MSLRPLYLIQIPASIGCKWSNAAASLTASAPPPYMTVVVAGGRVAQRESARLTREKSLVQSQPRPPRRPSHRAIGSSTNMKPNFPGRRKQKSACARRNFIRTLDVFYHAAKKPAKHSSTKLPKSENGVWPTYFPAVATISTWKSLASTAWTQARVGQLTGSTHSIHASCISSQRSMSEM